MVLSSLLIPDLNGIKTMIHLLFPYPFTNFMYLKYDDDSMTLY